jgi:hypothetical protein
MAFPCKTVLALKKGHWDNFQAVEVSSGVKSVGKNNIAVFGTTFDMVNSSGVIVSAKTGINIYFFLALAWG